MELNVSITEFGTNLVISLTKFCKCFLKSFRRKNLT